MMIEIDRYFKKLKRKNNNQINTKDKLNFLRFIEIKKIFIFFRFL